jgi:hypothetical protein
METRECVRVHECCVVPYRRTQFGIEFCLVTPNAENRWEFPKASLNSDSAATAEELDQAASNVGLRGQIDPEPLGHFAARRGNEARTMIGYLMQVEGVAETWPSEESHKRQWCLAEECRVRIRRKPLRQFIDLALHTVAALQSTTPSNGNGHGLAVRHD